MSKLRNLALWIVVALLVVLLFNLFQGTSDSTPRPSLTYSQFRQEVVQNDIKKITVQGDQVTGELKNGQAFATTVPNNDQSLWTLLREHDVNVTVAPPDAGVPTLVAVLLNWFPTLLLVAVLALLFLRLRPGAIHSDVQKPELNWRRGMLRTWLVATVLWLGFAGWHWYTEVYAPYAVTVREVPCVEHLRAHPNLGQASSCHDARYSYMDAYGFRVGTGVYALFAVVVPLGALGGGFAIGWVIAGFRRRPS